MPERSSSWRALAALTGLNVLNYTDRFVVAAVLPLVLAAFAFSDAQGGLLQSAFIVVYALVAPLAGWLGDRRPRLPIVAVAVLIWTAATMTSGLAPTFLLLLLARAVTGVGEAAYAVVTPAVLSDFYPPDWRGRALAIFYAAMPAGTALGYVVGGTVGGWWGWRPAFFVAGVPGLALALSLLPVREPRRGAQDAAEKAIATPLALRTTLTALIARRSYLFNTAAQVAYAFAMGGLATWMPTYFVRERHVPVSVVASVFGLLLVVAGFAGILLGGYLGDRAARRGHGGHFTVSGWSLIASLVFTVPAVLSPAPRIFWPSMLGALLLLFLNVGPLNAAMANVLPPDPWTACPSASP